MRTLALVSGKGGVGTTTLSVALSAALTALGIDTTLIDANLHTPDVGLHLGASNVAVGLHDVLASPENLASALYHHAPSGLKVIPGQPSLAAAKNRKHHEVLSLPLTLTKLPTQLVVFDCPNGIQQNTLAMLAISDEVLLVTTPELPAVIDTLKLLVRCKELRVPVRGVLLNRAGQHRHELASENVQSLLDTPIVAVIPNDSAVAEAQAAKHPVTYSHPDSPASMAVTSLAATFLP